MCSDFWFETLTMAIMRINWKEAKVDVEIS